MPIEMCPIDIPDGWEFVEAWVARDIFKKGDISISVIVRPAWQWPEWLTAGWIAMDESCEWYAFEYEPDCEDAAVWDSYNGSRIKLSGPLLPFIPPACDDWTKSLRKNPRSK